MSNNQLIEWLKENGGPAIKLNLIKESLIDNDSYNIDSLADEILRNERLLKVFSYFDQFEGYRSKGKPYALIHGCYENYFEVFMPIFINIGFHAGIRLFDEKIAVMKDVYAFLADLDMQKGDMPFTAVIIMLFLLKAGYCFDDIVEYTLQRLDKVHKITALEKFDFYEEDTANIRQYSRWKDKKILKDIYNPYVGEYPLPIIYDIKLLFYIYDRLSDDKARQKIDDIARYTLDPRYQQTGGDYGWHWDFRKKTYHASTSGLSLPLYNGSELGRRSWDILDYLDLASLSPITKKSDWMKECMVYLEQYRTERGTYLFPDSFFAHLTYQNPIPPTQLYEMFISKNILSKLKRNSVKSFAQELYSTYFFIKIKSRLIL